MRTRRKLELAGGIAAVLAATEVERRRRRVAGDAWPDVAGRHSSVTVSDGAELAITEVGTGPLVVFAHGWTEGRSIWSAVAAQVAAAGHHVVVYDQRGHGGSTVGADGISIERLGLDLGDILDAFDARDAVVVGHSMGGMTVMELLGRRPELADQVIKAAVLVSTGAAGLGVHPRVDAVAAKVVGSPIVTRAFAGRMGGRLVRRSFGRSPVAAHATATAALFASTPGTTRRDCLLAISAMDLRSGLAATRCPVTIVVGSRDHLTPPRLAREIAGLIPAAELVVVPGAGHQLPFEMPEKVASVVLRAAETGNTPSGLPGSISGLAVTDLSPAAPAVER